MAAEDRGDLMARHAQARARRERAALGSDEYRKAAEEVARIEIAIAAREEPSISPTRSSTGSSEETAAR